MGATSSTAGSRIRADELCGSDVEREALDRVRSVTGAEGGPLELHSLRCFLIAERLAADAELRFDREVLLVASLLHDIGLYEDAAEGGAYVTDGRHYAERMLAGRPGWEGERLRRCLDAIERHHELRSQWEAGEEVELLRRADLVEVSGGVAAFGIPRGWLRGLWRAVPRRGFYREIGALLARAARERPQTLPMIFVRGRGRDGASA